MRSKKGLFSTRDEAPSAEEKRAVAAAELAAVAKAPVGALTATITDSTPGSGPTAVLAAPTAVDAEASVPVARIDVPDGALPPSRSEPSTEPSVGPWRVSTGPGTLTFSADDGELGSLGANIQSMEYKHKDRTFRLTVVATVREVKQ